MIDIDAVRMAEHPYRAVLGYLQAYFPTPAIPPSSVALWAADLERYDLDVVAEAVETLGHFGVGGRPLQFADIDGMCDDVFRTRLRLRRPALTPGEFVEAAPEEVATIIRGYWDRVGGERRALAAARNARESGDPEARVEAARRLAAARIEAESEREPSHPRAVPAPGGMRTACGADAGSHAVEVHGVWCCPNCGSPIDEGCVGGAA